MITNCLIAENYEALYNIHQKQFNIGFLSIDEIEPDAQREYLLLNWDSIPTHYKCYIDKNSFDEDIKQLDNLYYVLTDNSDKKNLINFVKDVVSNFADVTDAPVLGLSIEKVTGDMCRFFHCDMNHLRLVYPLLGPGTLWTSDDNVRREFLGKGQNDQVIINKELIFQVQPKTITLLKGNGHPTGKNSAVVHASPAISSTKEKRILMRIESVF